MMGSITSIMGLSFDRNRDGWIAVVFLYDCCGDRRSQEI